MKTPIKIISAVVVILTLVFVITYIFKKGIITVNIPSYVNQPAAEIPATGQPGNLPGFTVPAGFKLSLFAKNVPGARVLEFDSKARLLVSETSEGKIVALADTTGDGAANEQKTLASGLQKPHGLVFNCDDAGKCYLYVAEQNMLSRYPYDAETPSLGAKEKLMDINWSAADRHFTRSLLFLPYPDQDTLLISVGSSCNVCHESDDEHATILYYNIKTKESGVYAKGLRNATFLATNPIDGKTFATEMGRDNLGDNLPPDEINIIEEKNNQPQNYGWPICYGQNIHDTNFDKNTYLRNPCMAPFTVPSFVDIPAHSAPLGLSFIPEEGWPESYWHNILIAYHGSWNRSTPTGYKIVRVKMDAKGNYLGTEDFITGWLTKDGNKIGRPVDIKTLPGGTAYISDDSAGVIYRLSTVK